LGRLVDEQIVIDFVSRHTSGRRHAGDGQVRMAAMNAENEGR
jgi:hypothetical protein